ncbi:MAG: hypothetical protein ABFR33_00010 [Verrucomicrobiota bacterium]
MKMKKLLSLTIVAALLSGAAQAASTVFFDDFDTYLVPGGTNYTTLVDKYVPLRVWALIHPVVDNPRSWYRGSAWVSMLSATNATGGNGFINQCPADSSAGTALKVGVWQNWGSREAFVNIDSVYDVNTNFTVSFRAMLKNETTNEWTVADNTATGSVNLAVGYMDPTTSNFVSVAGAGPELSATNWVEVTASANGGALTGSDTNAIGQSVILRFQRNFGSGNNSSNYQSWVDWVQVDASNPWAEYVDSAGLSSYDRTAHDDADGLDNFTEWAIGGDPKDPNDTGYAGHVFVMDMGADGTNEFVYVTPRITTAAGIQYSLDRTEDLVGGSWERQVTWDANEAGDYLWNWQPSESEGFGPGYNAVTNIFRMADTNGVVSDTAFIRMNIGHPDYNP